MRLPSFRLFVAGVVAVIFVSGCSDGADCDDSLFDVDAEGPEKRFETSESCLRSEFGDEFVLVDLEPRYEQRGFAISPGLADFGAFYEPKDTDEDPYVRIEFNLTPENSCFGFSDIALSGGRTLKIQERDDVTLGCLDGAAVRYLILLGGAPRGPDADALLQSIGNALIEQGAVSSEAR